MGDSRKNLQSIEEKPESPSFGVRARPGRAGRGRPFALESPLAVHQQPALLKPGMQPSQTAASAHGSAHKAAAASTMMKKHSSLVESKPSAGLSPAQSARRRPSHQMSKLEQKLLKDERERVADEERYKLIFGMPNFEFKRKASAAQPAHGSTITIGSRLSNLTQARRPGAEGLSQASQVGPLTEKTSKSARRSGESNADGVSEMQSITVADDDDTSSLVTSKQESVWKPPPALQMQLMGQTEPDPDAEEQESRANSPAQPPELPKKIRVPTQLVSPDAAVIPKGFIKRTPRRVLTKAEVRQLQIKENFKKSGYTKRFAYDDRMKVSRGDRLTIPSQHDFLKMKIAEREQLLYRVVEQGKEDLLKKRIRELDEQQHDNPYDRLVKRVELNQRQDLEKITNNRRLFQETIDRNNRLKEQKRIERDRNATVQKQLRAGARTTLLSTTMDDDRANSISMGSANRKMASTLESRSRCKARAASGTFDHMSGRSTRMGEAATMVDGSDVKSQTICTTANSQNMRAFDRTADGHAFSSRLRQSPGRDYEDGRNTSGMSHQRRRAMPMTSPLQTMPVAQMASTLTSPMTVGQGLTQRGGQRAKGRRESEQLAYEMFDPVANFSSNADASHAMKRQMHAYIDMQGQRLGQQASTFITKDGLALMEELNCNRLKMATAQGARPNRLR